MRNLPRAVFFLFLPLLFSPSLLRCQELGISFLGATTGHPEFPSPLGFTAHGLFRFNPSWFFLVSYGRLSDEQVRTGRVCQHYVPHVGCRNEETTTSLSLSGLNLGALRALHEGQTVRLMGGGGLSFSSLGGEARGVSGLPGDLLIPKGGQIGAFGSLKIGLRPLASLPAMVEGGVNLHWIKFNSCSGAEPPQYDPFCKPDIFQEAEIGISFPFR